MSRIPKGTGLPVKKTTVKTITKKTPSSTSVTTIKETKRVPSEKQTRPSTGPPQSTKHGARPKQILAPTTKPSLSRSGVKPTASKSSQAKSGSISTVSSKTTTTSIDEEGRKKVQVKQTTRKFANPTPTPKSPIRKTTKVTTRKYVLPSGPAQPSLQPSGLQRPMERRIPGPPPRFTPLQQTQQMQARSPVLVATRPGPFPAPGIAGPPRRSPLTVRGPQVQRPGPPPDLRWPKPLAPHRPLSPLPGHSRRVTPRRPRQPEEYSFVQEMLDDSSAPPLSSSLIADIQRQQEIERSIRDRAQQQARIEERHQTEYPLPVIMTAEGPVPATHQVILERNIDRTPGAEYVSRRMSGIEADGRGSATRVDLNIDETEPSGLSVIYGAGPGAPIHETVSVTNSMIVSPGATQRSKHVVYEITKAPGGTSEEGAGLDTAQVSQLVQEETEDVVRAMELVPPELKRSSPNTYALKKKIQHIRLTSDSMALLEESVVPPIPTGEEPPEELQPEVVAAIMHTEELGLSMDAPPTHLYNYLFPDTKDDPVISISSAAPAPLQDVVIPTTQPQELHRSVMNEELQQAALVTQSTAHKPIDSIYSESVMKKGGPPKVSNIAGKGKRKQKTKHIPILAAETPPWGIEELQPMMDLVGAAPSNTLTVSDATAFEQSLLSGGLEYVLIPEPPRHISRVQLRGSQKPSWFPGIVSNQGYLVALPDLQDTVKIAKSPSAVLHAAWKAVQPSHFPDNSFASIG